MRRIRNVRGTTVVAVLTVAATALGPVATASAQASAKKVTIKVVGISRTGATVSVSSDVAPPQGNVNLGTGPTYHYALAPKPAPALSGRSLPGPILRLASGAGIRV